MKKNRFTIKCMLLVSCLLLFLLFTLSACAQTPADAEKPLVGVSIPPQAGWVETLSEGAVDLVVMVPPGTSPANHEPIASDMKKLSRASLYFTIGVNTETANILPLLEDRENIRQVALDEAVRQVYEDRYFSFGGRDPHIWLSPKRVKLMVDLICQELSLLLPEKASTFRANRDAYLEELDALDQELKETLGPLKGQSFIVFHPAFGYLAQDYGLVMLALEEEGKEASAKRLKEMTDRAQKEDLKVIFYQEEISSKQAQAFAQALGGEAMQLSPLSPDYLANMQAMAQKIGEVIYGER